VGVLAQTPPPTQNRASMRRDETPRRLPSSVNDHREIRIKFPNPHVDGRSPFLSFFEFRTPSPVSVPVFSLLPLPDLVLMQGRQHPDRHSALS
jgi:hypothetical protein